MSSSRNYSICSCSTWHSGEVQLHSRACCRPDKTLLLGLVGAPECGMPDGPVCNATHHTQGKACMGRLADSAHEGRQAVSQWVKKAHGLGLVIHAYTTRNEVWTPPDVEPCAGNALPCWLADACMGESVAACACAGHIMACKTQPENALPGLTRVRAIMAEAGPNRFEACKQSPVQPVLAIIQHPEAHSLELWW